MNKYKIGQRVRVIKKGSKFYNCKASIWSKETEGFYKLGFTSISGSYGVLFREEEIELIKEDIINSNNTINEIFLRNYGIENLF